MSKEAMPDEWTISSPLQQQYEGVKSQPFLSIFSIDFQLSDVYNTRITNLLFPMKLNLYNGVTGTPEVGRGASEHHHLTKSTIIGVRKTVIGVPNFGTGVFYSDRESFNSNAGVNLENHGAFNSDVGVIFEDVGVKSTSVGVRNSMFDVILSVFLRFI